jgi:DNA-binding PadR family transcriptional regulator
MRDRPGWMNKASEPTLEVLEEAKWPLPTVTIRLVLDRELSDPPSKPTVYRALEPLEKRGFIQKISNGTDHYEITEKGRKWIQEELPAEEIEDGE